MKLVGTPISVTITTPSVSDTKVTTIDIEPAVDLEKKKVGNADEPQVIIKDRTWTLSFKSLDHTPYSDLEIGRRVYNIVALMQSPLVNDSTLGTNSIGLNQSAQYSYTIASATLERGGKVTGEAGGSANEVEYVFVTHTKPTFAWT